MTDTTRYVSPLSERYASRAMLELWSPRTRYTLWRTLWLRLAEAQQALGVAIPDEAIAQMRAHLDDMDFERVAEYERRLRHDVSRADGGTGGDAEGDAALDTPIGPDRVDHRRSGE